MFCWTRIRPRTPGMYWLRRNASGFPMLVRIDYPDGVVSATHRLMVHDPGMFGEWLEWRPVKAFKQTVWQWCRADDSEHLATSLSQAQ